VMSAYSEPLSETERTAQQVVVPKATDVVRDDL
jgi:hypothetical protein